MIKFLFILLLPTYIFAAQILSYNIYDRTERVDVMLTFDTPFKGVIKKSSNNSKIIIKLANTTIESSKIKKVNSKFLKSLTIIPMQKYTQIVATVGEKTKLIASKTADGYGLRLRFTQKQPAKKQQTVQTTTNKPNLSLLPTKKSEDIPTRYYIVISILFILVLILLVVKKRVTNKQEKQKSWLFKNDTKDVEKKTNTNEVSIRFQKPIDSQNSVVMLDFAEYSYLVMVGNGNILLDKFTENKPSTQEDFETMLQKKHEQLDEFLQIEKNSITPQENNYEEIEEKEPLQIYKEKAAMSYYTQNS